MCRPTDPPPRAALQKIEGFLVGEVRPTDPPERQKTVGAPELRYFNSLDSAVKSTASTASTVASTVSTVVQRSVVSRLSSCQARQLDSLDSSTARQHTTHSMGNSKRQPRNLGRTSRHHHRWQKTEINDGPPCIRARGEAGAQSTLFGIRFPSIRPAVS